MKWDLQVLQDRVDLWARKESAVIPEQTDLQGLSDHLATEDLVDHQGQPVQSERAVLLVRVEIRVHLDLQDLQALQVQEGLWERLVLRVNLDFGARPDL